MDTYHLLFTAENQIIIVENHPDALDLVPYDLVERRQKKLLDAGLADLMLQMNGGTAIYHDRPAVRFTPI